MRFAGFPEFRPNCTPREMFRLGIFGGTYWRPIHSRVTGRDYRGKHREFAFLSRIPEKKLCATVEDVSLNHYRVHSGTTLRYWEDQGWIRAQDPYGWVQWYCRFYSGRRSPDDARQIARWVAFASEKSGRFRRALKRMRAEGKDSPAIRQGLLQWGVKT